MTFLPLKTVVSAFQASLSGVPEPACGFAVADLKVELPAEVAVVDGEVMVKLASSSEPVNPAVLTKVSFTLGATCTPDTTVAPASPWTAVSSGTGESLNGAFSDATSVWVVGNGGKVLFAPGGGTSFSTMDIGTTSRLLAVSKVGDAVVAAGESGTAWFLEPGSGAWSESVVSTMAHIQALVAHGDLLVGVGSLGTILYSSNQGHTFDALPSITQDSLHAVTVSPDGRLWAAGAKGAVLTSTDVKTWKPVPALAPQQWYSLSPTPDGRVVAAGESGKVAIFTPGGGELASPCTTKDLYAVHAMESGAVLAVGADGAAVWSKDGTTFTALTPPTTQSLHAISPLDGGKLLVVGAGGVALQLDTTTL